MRRKGVVVRRAIPRSVFLPVLFVVALPSFTRAADGALDLAFGTAGKVITAFGVPAATATSVVLQPDGKIVAAGWLFDETANIDFALARYNADGSLDNSFGIGGRVRTDFFGLDDVANAVALQADGKIIVAGTARVGFDLRIALARYNVDGSLDSTFDLNGKAVTPDASGIAYGVAIQPDGKILVAGSNFVLVRFNVDGSLDTGFGKGGELVIRGLGATALTLQLDGKIVVAGSIDTKSGTGDDFAVARVNSDGSLDKTFGSGGIVTTDFFGSGDVAWAVTLQPDGRIVVGGYAADSLSVGPHFGVARYNADGSPDLTFDGDGRTSTDFPGFDEVAFGVAVQGDGKILAAGRAFGTAGYDFAIVRYTPNGAEDPGFGTSGRVTTDFFGRSDGIRGILLQPDGKIIAAGGAQDETTGYFALARYLSSPSAPTGCPHS
ncbi:MAG TPA: delta-60 repeat domain-containing protein, partial [Thermoanaerobaculia bacterium]